MRKTSTLDLFDSCLDIQVAFAHKIRLRQQELDPSQSAALDGMLTAAKAIHSELTMKLRDQFERQHFSMAVALAAQKIRFTKRTWPPEIHAEIVNLKKVSSEAQLQAYQDLFHRMVELFQGECDFDALNKEAAHQINLNNRVRLEHILSPLHLQIEKMTAKTASRRPAKSAQS